ncbi:Glycerophosphodiester phosphodiesterase [Adhaeribacter pallidiroseus]|uniref:Glycerophosphodiester phosphodiesterase n=2 Tax=Adhaeribacter pallidiroseus TaxID=2072847 RepID=A0A369QHN5_9BACT|nr:Glycerophosphodiester phosphodiesterase [Adhaeribacter pallidiroseus]
MLYFYQNSIGQTNQFSPVYLANYTFAKDRLVIGLVKLRTGKDLKIQSTSLSGKHADFFKISKDHQLSVRKEKVNSANSPLEVVVKVKTATAEYQNSFRIVKDAFIRNKVVAHRGAWKNTGVAENSVASLNHAVALGCEGSEFDVQMSADSVLYVNHDAAIQGISIAKAASQELNALKLSHGEAFPTLENYLKAGLKQTKTKLILEIKASELGKESSLAATRKIVKMVEDLQAQAWVDYISFDYDVCTAVMKLAPYARVAYLNGDKTPTELAQANFFGLDYHFKVLQKNPSWMKEAKQNKLTINVWTVNEKAMLENFLKENVDFITTNEPEMLLEMITGK